ncbi:MAG: 1-acyl-sn-glycerol-3-phosphate acyltransferase [Bacteroidales bacterium]|nr:1-acyl-sn-glycerol-3-phosphate acyltransferase [Bacteroidales bacterium]
MRKFLFILFQPYKWLIVFPLIVLLTILSVAVLTLVAFFSVRGSNRIGSFWAKSIQLLVFMRVKVIGRENIQKNQSYIVVANHQSPFDIIALYANLGIDFRWIMKKELRKVPVLGYGCEKLQHIYIDRASARSAYRSLQEAKAKLVDGTSVAIFPEGTRTYSNNLAPFKHGAFKMALDLGLPILPVTIKDTHKIMGRSVHSLFPGNVMIVVHKPMEVQIENREQRDEFIEQTREVIMSGMEVGN